MLYLAEGWGTLTEASKGKLCFVGVNHCFQRNSYRPALESEKASLIDVVGPSSVYSPFGLEQGKWKEFVLALWPTIHIFLKRKENEKRT